MKWIGLTGSLGTGKSAASDMIKKKGFVVIDADLVARLVVSPGSVGIKKIEQEFGKQFLNPDGSLDRKKMGDLVFKNADDLKKLESILHPLIQQEVKKIREQAQSRGEKIAFYVVPLLFEKNMQTQFDKVVVVTCDENKQLDRIMKRDSLQLDQAQSRMRLQISVAEKAKKADYVINNNGTIQDLETEVSKFLQNV